MKPTKPRKKYWFRIETVKCHVCKTTFKYKIKLNSPTFSGKFSFIGMSNCPCCIKKEEITSLEPYQT